MACHTYQEVEMYPSAVTCVVAHDSRGVWYAGKKGTPHVPLLDSFTRAIVVQWLSRLKGHFLCIV